MANGGRVASANASPRHSPLARVMLFVLIVLLARVLYLAWLSPWRLVFDEAQYWVWAQHLDWSYYTKGPGVAWVIWASTRLFGDHEWSVRLPTAISAAVMAWAGARLAYDITGRNARAAWYAAVLLTITPGFVGTAQLMTPDSFYASAWLLTALCAFHAVRADASGSMRVLAWIGVGATLGLGFLFKYTALLLVPGLVGWLFWIRRDTRVAGGWIAGFVAATLALVVVASPVWIWNAQHGWPTIAHQLGRVHLPGGDETVQWAWSPMWFVSFAGAQIGLLGGVGAWLVCLAVAHVRRPIAAVAEGVDRRVGVALLIWLAIPILGGYLALAIVKELQANWAIAGFTTLLVLAGIVLADVLPVRRERKLPLRAAWHWTLGINLVVMLVVLFGPAIFRLPGLRESPRVQRLARRMSDGPLLAAAVQAHREQVPDALLICDNYPDASFLAFYLPDHPTTFVARHILGGRPTPWDFFEDTDLRAPALERRDALLVGGSRDRWQRGFVFATIQTLSDPGKGNGPKVFRATQYGGVREGRSASTQSADELGEER